MQKTKDGLSKIQMGDRIEFKPEFQDDGDSTIVFTAIENEDGGRFKVIAELGLPINPVQVVTVEMVARFIRTVKTYGGYVIALESATDCRWFDGKAFGSFYSRKVYRSESEALDIAKTTEF